MALSLPLPFPVMHLPVKFGADIFIQSGVIDILPKLKMSLVAVFVLLTPKFDGTYSVRRPILFLKDTYVYANVFYFSVPKRIRMADYDLRNPSSVMLR